MVVYAYVIDLYNIQVLGATLDGATSNRRMVRLHSESALTYKTRNIHTNDGHEIFSFFLIPLTC